MIWERKYGDFLRKPPNFVPQIKSWYLGIFLISSFYKNESEVKRQLAAGVGTHDVAVHLQLSVLKAKHANWIVDN